MSVSYLHSLKFIPRPDPGFMLLKHKHEITISWFKVIEILTWLSSSLHQIPRIATWASFKKIYTYISDASNCYL